VALRILADFLEEYEEQHESPDAATWFRIIREALEARLRGRSLEP
jgi:hypothetical protein